MATVNMSSNVLDVLNDIYKKKESAAEVENLLCNLKLDSRYTSGKRVLEVREYPIDPNSIHAKEGKVINSTTVPEELRQRLIQCAMDYYKEKLREFESITVNGECFVMED